MPDELRLPVDVQLEREILGCCFQENRDPIAEVRSVLAEEDFSLEQNKYIFRALAKLADAGDPLTLTTIYGELRSRGTPVELGTLSEYFCPELDFALPRNLERAKLLSHRRRAVLIGRELMLTAGDHGADFAECVDSTVSRLRDISGSTTASDVDDTVEGIVQSVGGITEFFKAHRGVKTPWTDVNEVTGGWSRGELSIIAARPSMGKTAFALNALMHAAKIGLPSVFYSAEMTREAILKRLISLLTGITFMQLQRGDLNQEERKAANAAMATIMALPLRIHAAGGKTALAIRSHMDRMHRRSLCQFALLDYIGLVKGNSRTENRNRELGEICRQFKTAAMELNIPMCVLAQLNRAVESRTDKRPIMSDLRDSGELEEHADMIAFLHRPEYYSREDESLRGVAELIIGKQRNGPTPIIPLHFDFHGGKFSDPQ